jgi:hypothetical protein
MKTLTYEPASTPMEALDLQLDLHRWWRTPNGEQFGRYFGRSVFERYGKAGRRQITDLALLNLAEYEAQALGRASTYFVTEDMVAFTSFASKSLGMTTNLQPQDLPHPYGFVYLQGGIEMRDVHDKTYVIKGIAWSTEAYQDAGLGTRDDSYVLGVDYALYSDPRDERENDGFRDDFTDDNYPALVLFHLGALIFGKNTWPQPEDLPSVLTADGAIRDLATDDAYSDEQLVASSRSTLDFEKWLMAFFLNVNETITLIEPGKVTRAAKRRAERILTRSPDEDTVRVVKLRKGHPTPREHDEADEDAWLRWSHRWWVMPHWRTLNRGTPQEKIVRVRGHIKGPEHAPLVLRDTIYRWER